MDWSSHFPAYAPADVTTEAGVRVLAKQVEVADVGCGFGGLLVALSPLLQDSLILGMFPATLASLLTMIAGMELRSQVLDYVTNRIVALRSQETHEDGARPSRYQNISALRTNSMKFMPNYFSKGQLSKIFLCFPDPHFKQRKHKARIVSAQLNAEYAFVLKAGGKVYTITDVEELHQWMISHFEGEEAGTSSGLWDRIEGSDLEEDPCIRVMSEETEEAKKVTRNGGRKFVAAWKRRPDPAWSQ